jgi:pilus assembly protein CpaE
LIAADNIVLTATPDLTSLRNCKMIVEFLRQSRPNDALPLLVMNQVGQPKRPEISPEEFAEAVRIDLGPIIPFNALLFGRAANNGQLIADFAEKSSTTKTFLDIAKIINGYRISPTRRSVPQRFLRLIKRWW